MNKKILLNFSFLFCLLLLSGCVQTKNTPTSTQTKTYTLLVYIRPVEGGRVVLEPQGGVYTEGTIVNLEAVANSGYIFDRWEGSITGRQNQTTIVMDSNKTVYAYFVSKSTPQVYYKLYVNIYPQNAGEVNIVPFLNDYPEGSQVQITALPKEGYIFSNWSGDVTDTQNPITIVMNSDKNITANFIEKQSGGNGGGVILYKLTVSINPDGAGEVSLNPIGGEYIEGTQVEIKAVAKSGYVFHSWGGDLSGAENPTYIVMNSNKDIIANFIQGYILTVEINPPEGGSVIFSPEGTKITEYQRVYLPGTSVSLTATPNTGYKFHQWLGGIGAPFQNNKANPLSVTINSSFGIIASFVNQ